MPTTINSDLYPMIFKRKSFHEFPSFASCNKDEVKKIKEFIKTLTPLDENIPYAIKLVKGGKTNCRRGEEYCLLFYSKKEGNYLQNIGYIGEQIDLYLASIDIGALWYGLGSVKERNVDGLSFVIMMAFHKEETSSFRTDVSKAKRKSLDEYYSGEPIKGVSDFIIYSPSACNTQPWKVSHEGNTLKVYRYEQQGKRGIMPVNKVSYYNRIDVGIFLLFLELCLNKEGYGFTKRLELDEGNDQELTLEATYEIG
ncbi:MAG: nitroreductase [Bacilli bacterium]|jgi:hypothetical protein|nr:nitroreductase [Bacilli bacterium]MCH4211088.1 nitroreductase [Bacilli bacterium]MCH4228629.1 nitroreductase [Bacilli bacterium]MCI2054863.1 nitroreductase [Bacilli bacterium]